MESNLDNNKKYSDYIKITYCSQEEETAFGNFICNNRYEYEMFHHLPEPLEDMIERSNRALGLNPEYRDVLYQVKRQDENLKTIKRFIKETIKEKLYIIDRYIFPQKFDSDYLDNLISLINECSAKRIVFVVSSTYNNVLYDRIEKILTGKVDIELIVTDNFHDRFWLSPPVYGFLMGTSLNGVGKRISSVQKLYSNDVIELIREVLTK